MNTFKEIAEEYKESLEEAKLKKRKIWKMVDGNLKKIVKKECWDSDGKAAGWQLTDGGKKCKKLSSNEIHGKKIASKKSQRTKIKHASKIKRNMIKINKKKMAKGLIQKPSPENTLKA